MIWTASSEKMTSRMRKMRTFRSSCAWSKYNARPCSQFIHSVISNDSVSRLGGCARDLGICCPQMPEDTFLPAAAKICSCLLHIKHRKLFKTICQNQNAVTALLLPYIY